MRLKSRMALSMEEPNTLDTSTRSTSKDSLANELVIKYYAYLYRLAISILLDPQEADDAVQETMLRALAHEEVGMKDVEMRRWLSVIVVNQCRDRLRRAKAHRNLVSLLGVLRLTEQHSPSVEGIAVNNQRHSTLWLSVQKLDESHRLPVILKFVHGMNAQEIAGILHIQEGTVYSRLHYAIHKLRKCLGDAFEEGDLE